MKPYIGEIRIFAFDEVPAGWLRCDGRTCSDKQYPGLFAVIGTTYGGGGDTFKIPDLGGRTIASVGAGAMMGQQTGAPHYTLELHQMPAHNHAAHAALPASGNTGLHAAPAAGDRLSRLGVGANGVGQAWQTDPAISLYQDAVTMTGGGRPIDTHQPFIALKAYIACEGVMPAYSSDEPVDPIVKGDAPG